MTRIRRPSRRQSAAAEIADALALAVLCGLIFMGFSI